MSNVDNLLARLDRVKRTRPGHWTARCPAHDDRGPSLAVRELDDGRILVHCFSGCELHSILAAVDLKIDDLFPEPLQHGRPERRPFFTIDAFRAVARDCLVVCAAAAIMRQKNELSEADFAAMIESAGRIQGAVDAVTPLFNGVRYGNS